MLLFITDLLQQTLCFIFEMADIIPRFIAELKDKLSFKASSKVAIDTLLLKTFKFFDLQNSGVVPENEFYRTLAKVGVVFESPDIMRRVFEYYDKNQSGKINYKDFIAEVLFESEPQEESLRNSTHKGDSKVGTKAIVKAQIKIQAPLSLQRQPNSLKVEPSSSPTKPEPPTPQKYVKLSSGQEVVQHLKQVLKEEGVDSLLSLAVRLKEEDTTRIHKLPLNKVCPALKWLTKDQIIMLLEYYKTPAGGMFNYGEFIYSLKSNTTPERVALINTTFQQIAAGKDQIPIETLLQKYKENSLIDKGKFDKACALYCKFQGIDDGVFTFEDYDDLVGFIGFGITGDQKFRSWLLRSYGEEEEEVKSRKSMRSRDFPQRSQGQPDRVSQRSEKASRLSEVKVDFNIQPQVPQQQDFKKRSKQVSEVQSEASKAVSTDSKKFMKEIELILLRIKKRLASKGPRGYLLFEKAMRAIDTDNDSLVSVHEFKKVIKDQKIDITETEANFVFEIFDQQRTLLINYPEFVYTIRGQIPENREKLIYRVYEKVRIPGETFTTFSQIKKIFTARAHPDTKNGRRFEEDIIKQLNESLLYVQDLNGVRSEEISKEDFVECMENFSASISDDQLFETIMNAVWRLESVVKIEEEYAGSKKRFDMKNNSYLIDHHRYMIDGGTVSQNAPFGTYNEITYPKKNDKMPN